MVNSPLDFGTIMMTGASWISSPARWLAAGHPGERPRRPLRAAEQHARLDLDRALPSVELRRAELHLRRRIGVEIAVAVMPAHQHRRLARLVLIGMGRDHLE